MTDTLGLRLYLAELRIAPGLTLAGKSLIQSGLGRDFDMVVLTIIWEGESQLDPPADAKFSDDDLERGGLRLAEVVLLQGSPFIGRTPKALQMRERYQIQMLPSTAALA